MSRVLFVTRDGIAQPRWKIAFPDCGCESSIPASVNLNYSLIFCDMAGITEQQQSAWLDECLMTGLPVIVMNSVPNATDGLRSLQKGTRGYCHTLAAAPQLQQIRNVVENGGYWLGPDLVGAVIQASVGALESASFVEGNESDPQYALLTQREKEVAALVAQGATNKQIAQTLNISERTVKAHVAALFNKYDIHDRVQLALRLTHQI